MLGGLISDLETGDVFEPVRYMVTSLAVGQYAVNELDLDDELTVGEASVDAPKDGSG